MKTEDKILQSAIADRNKRSKTNLPKTKLIRDLRLYDDDLPGQGLYPYGYQYIEIFLQLLRLHGLHCPKYSHLYIQVGETKEEALQNAIQGEDWYINGIATINYKKYKSASKAEKEKMVFKVICDGLMDIAKLDKLDIKLIEKVIKQVKQKGLDTELLFRLIENKKYTLQVTYLSRNMEEKCPVFFSITDKESGKTVKKQVGKADNTQLPMWLQKITLTNKLVKIKSSGSVAAGVWLGQKAKAMELDIESLMAGKKDYLKKAK